MIKYVISFSEAIRYAGDGYRVQGEDFKKGQYITKNGYGDLVIHDLNDDTYKIVVLSSDMVCQSYRVVVSDREIYRNKDREDGYYWVKKDTEYDGWIIAYWDSFNEYWMKNGWAFDEREDDDYWEEIDERRLERVD